MANEKVIERLKVLMVKLGIGSVTKWSKMLDIPQATLDKKLRGEQKLDFRTLMRVIELHPEVRTEWLLRGIEPIFVGNEVSHGDDSLKDIQIALLENDKKSLTRRLENLRTEVDALHQDLREKDEQLNILLNQHKVV